MGAEYLWLRKRRKARAARGGPDVVGGDYVRNDALASLAMGTASLFAPLIARKVLAPIAPKGKYRNTLLGTAVGAVALTSVADFLARRGETSNEAARRVAKVAAPVAVATTGVAVTTAWWSALTMEKLWQRRFLPDLGTGVIPMTAAMIGWDFIYYWNHRFMHESRYMWAIHVVHHSSEHYNLATALRQPVADVLGTFVPYGVLCLFGVRPDLIVASRGWNLLYQYWIHTETIDRMGPAEECLNTPSHHRAHHGVNPQYIDRNHAGIFIIWDRLFGTFEKEREKVVYGLTKNINTYTPSRIASHEHRDILRDVSQATSWRERLQFVLRGPGWAYEQHAQRALVHG